MKNQNKFLIIDERMRQVEQDVLASLGYQLIKIKHSKKVYEEISSHVDIFACKIGNELVVEPYYYDMIRDIIKKDYIVCGNSEIGNKYPNDIKYNVCTIGNVAVHNFKYTDEKIIEVLNKNNYNLININQGYSNCSIAVIDEKSIITCDKGIYNVLRNENIDILFLNYQPDIKLLSNNKYSLKSGFIGGVLSRIEDNIFVSGDLNIIDEGNQIRDFIEKRNLKIIDFEGLDVVDFGGIVEI